MPLLRRLLGALAALVLGTAAVPAQTPSSSPAPAALSVPAGTATAGDVTVFQGAVDVYGTVRGDVMVFDGDVILHPGARVDGDAISVLGRVRNLGGATVGGQARSYAEEPPAWGRVRQATTGMREGAGPGQSLRVTVGWFVVLVIIAVGVLVSGSTYLDGVTESLEQGVGRALALGLVGQLLVLPALVTLVLLLCVTVVGILAIPLAVVAFVLGVAGLVTLGFLAVAFLTGRSIVGGAGRRRAAAARGEALRALGAGLAVYFALWIAAAALSNVPTAAILLRAAAATLTWLAATAGLGAAIASRAGTRPQGTRAPLARDRGAAPVDRSGVPVWQTPTPIGGIVAARRPTPVPQRTE